MSQEGEANERLQAFKDFQITSELLDQASDDVCFLHCLPAHEGEEIAENLFDDQRTQHVWTQAGNRLHAQKALLEYLISE
jgi:ornithine carbamoyltransferase